MPCIPLHWLDRDPNDWLRCKQSCCRHTAAGDMDSASMSWHALLSLFTRAVGSKALHRFYLDSLISLCLSVHFWFMPGLCVIFLATPYRQSIPPVEVWQTSLFLKQPRPTLGMVCSALQCAAGTAKGGSPLARISPASDFKEVLDPTDIIINLHL